MIGNPVYTGPANIRRHHKKRKEDSPKYTFETDDHSSSEDEKNSAKSSDSDSDEQKIVIDPLEPTTSTEPQWLRKSQWLFTALIVLIFLYLTVVSTSSLWLSAKNATTQLKYGDIVNIVNTATNLSSE